MQNTKEFIAETSAMLSDLILKAALVQDRLKLLDKTCADAGTAIVKRDQEIGKLKADLEASKAEAAQWPKEEVEKLKDRPLSEMNKIGESRANGAITAVKPFVPKVMKQPIGE